MRTIGAAWSFWIFFLCIFWDWGEIVCSLFPIHTNYIHVILFTGDCSWPSWQWSNSQQLVQDFPKSGSVIGLPGFRMFQKFFLLRFTTIGRRPKLALRTLNMLFRRLDGAAGQVCNWIWQSGNRKATFLNGISFVSFAHGFGGFSDGMIAYDGKV